MPVVPAAVALAGAAVVLVLVGSRFARLVDHLADVTGLGEALAGAVLLGLTTSLPGLITTVVAATDGAPDLAVSNAVGGIAAQTMFIALADLAYRPANLEHAAASEPNLLQNMLLIVMVGLVLLAAAGPNVSVVAVHPVSILLALTYLYGLRLTRMSGEAPMWSPRTTPQTREDVPATEAPRRPIARLWAEFALLAGIVAVAGFVVARAGISLSERTGLSGTAVGGVITAVVTSLPELVTVLAAVRIGALTLAVGDIIGGNTFDVLFVTAADAAFRDGSVYHALTADTLYVMALALLMAALLGAGQVRRARRGIGFEGIAMLTLYFASVAVLIAAG